MNRVPQAVQATLAILRAVLVLSLCNLALAQGGSITGSIRDRATHQGLQGVIVTARDARTGLQAGAETTDFLGHFELRLPAFGPFTLTASKVGYLAWSETHPFELSEDIPDHTAPISLMREPESLNTPNRPLLTSNWGTGVGKSYVIPALEIPAFLFLLNRYDRMAYPNAVEEGKNVYDVSYSTFRDHVLHGRWGVDQDAFAMNQFNHPYQGTIYHGFARSAGLTYWQSLLYDNAGSLIWETAGETTHPSINDQIASGTGGSFFGEALFRMANLMLEDDRDGSKPGFWHKLGATMLSPAMGFNRLAFGDRFTPLFSSNNPSLRWRLQLGQSTKSDLNNQGITSTTHQKEATVDYAMDYGLPGKLGYTYDRPFDYFQFEVTSLGNKSNPVDNIMIRGLLYGTDYDAGDAYQGIWGLYGGYDYISPYIFRVSSTSLSVGTTFQWSPWKPVALQGSLLGGFGYAAGGNVSPIGERDYHYGIGPQGLFALRLILGDRAMFDLTGRTFYLNGKGGIDPGGNEVIRRMNMGFTVRLYDRHALGIQYILSSRDTRYPGIANGHQTVGTVALVYNLLGHAGLGAIK